MLKWSEMLSRLVPWLGTDGRDEEQQLREEVADLDREQRELAPYIADQTEYLVRKGSLNGFTRQLRLGFQHHTAGE